MKVMKVISDVNDVEKKAASADVKDTDHKYDVII